MHTATVMRCRVTNTATSPPRASNRSSAGKRTERKYRSMPTGTQAAVSSWEPPSLSMRE